MKEKMRLIMEISLIIRELSYSRRGCRPESYAAALDNLTIIGDLADIVAQHRSSDRQSVCSKDG